MAALSRSPLLWTALAGTLLYSATAKADRSFDVGMAQPALDAYGMTVVERARTPQKFEIGTNAVFGWSHSPFRPTLSDPDMGLSPQRFSVIDNQLTIDLGVSIGLADFLSIAASAPMGVNFYEDYVVGSPAVPQKPSATNPTGLPAETGLYANQPRQTLGISTAGPRDPRLAIKARFYSNRIFEIGSIVELTIPLGDSSSFFGEKNATFRPRLLGGFMFGRLNIALSFGGIVREGAILFDPYAPMTPRFETNHELSWGVGVGLLAHQIVSFGVESFGTIPVAGDTTFATASLLGTLYFRPTEKWRISLAGGGGLIADSPRNADGMLLLGLAYSLSPREGGLR